MLKQRQNHLGTLFLVLSLILLGSGCSDGTNSNSTGANPLHDSGWTMIIPPQVIGHGEGSHMVPPTQLQSYFNYDIHKKLKSIDGVAGYGAFYTEHDLTVDLLIKKEQLTITNKYVGGLVSNFSYKADGETHQTYTRDVHRDIDSTTSNPEINFLETKQYGDTIHWVALTGQKKILYYHAGVVPVDSASKQEKYSGDAQLLDVKFPPSGLPKELKLLVFYEDAAIEHFYDNKWYSLHVPSAAAGYSTKSVEWGLDSNQSPHVVVGHTNAAIDYYHPGREDPWIGLSGPLPERGLPIVKVQWTDTPEETAEIVAGYGNGEIWYKKGLDGKENWVQLRAAQETGFAPNICQLEVRFADTKDTSTAPYPEVLCIEVNGRIAYFNGNADGEWLDMRDPVAGITPEVMRDGNLYHSTRIIVRNWTSGGTTDYSWTPEFCALWTVDYDEKIKGGKRHTTVSALDLFYTRTPYSHASLHLYRADAPFLPGLRVTELACAWNPGGDLDSSGLDILITDAWPKGGVHFKQVVYP